VPNEKLSSFNVTTYNLTQSQRISRKCSCTHHTIWTWLPQSTTYLGSFKSH